MPRTRTMQSFGDGPANLRTARFTALLDDRRDKSGSTLRQKRALVSTLGTLVGGCLFA